MSASLKLQPMRHIAGWASNSFEFIGDCILFLLPPPPTDMTGRSTGVIARLYTPPDMASRASTSTARHEPIRALPAKSNVRCLIVVSSRTNSTPLFFSHFTRKVRTAGLTFKIVTNFIRRVRRGVHHRHPTFPPIWLAESWG